VESLRVLRTCGDNLIMKEEKFVEQIKQESIDSHIKNKCMAAADNVSSNAYLLFVNMHCEEQMYVRTGRARQLRGSFTTPAMENITAEAAEKWKNMQPNHKLPFFLKAYLGTLKYDKSKFEMSSEDTDDMFYDVSYSSEDEDKFIL
jgi:hypothetical protein